MPDLIKVLRSHTDNMCVSFSTLDATTVKSLLLCVSNTLQKKEIDTSKIKNIETLKSIEGESFPIEENTTIKINEVDCIKNKEGFIKFTLTDDKEVTLAEGNLFFSNGECELGIKNTIPPENQKESLIKFFLKLFKRFFVNKNQIFIINNEMKNIELEIENFKNNKSEKLNTAQDLLKKIKEILISKKKNKSDQEKLNKEKETNSKIIDNFIDQIEKDSLKKEELNKNINCLLEKNIKIERSIDKLNIENTYLLEAEEFLNQKLKICLKKLNKEKLCNDCTNEVNKLKNESDNLNKLVDELLNEVKKLQNKPEQKKLLGIIKTVKDEILGVQSDVSQLEPNIQKSNSENELQDLKNVASKLLKRFQVMYSIG